MWIGLTLSGVAWIGMQLFSSRPAGDAMAVTIWGSSSSWTLTALPLFIWMGEILFRTRLSQRHVPRPGAVDAGLPGPAAAHQRGRLRDLRRGVGLERRHLRHHRQDDLPELTRRGYPDDIAIGSLAGAGTLGLLIPPSIIMIVYGVTRRRVDRAAVHRRRAARASCWRALFSGYLVVWALAQPARRCRRPMRR